MFLVPSCWLYPDSTVIQFIRQYFAPTGLHGVLIINLLTLKNKKTLYETSVSVTAAEALQDHASDCWATVDFALKRSNDKVQHIISWDKLKLTFGNGGIRTEEFELLAQQATLPALTYTTTITAHQLHVWPKMCKLCQYSL